MTLHVPPVISLPRMSMARNTFSAGERVVPEETPIALLAVTRKDGFEVFTHPDRIDPTPG